MEIHYRNSFVLIARRPLKSDHCGMEIKLIDSISILSLLKSDHCGMEIKLIDSISILSLLKSDHCGMEMGVYTYDFIVSC